MLHEIFILTLTLVLFALFYWGFKTLPGESWQFLGCIPVGKREDGSWNAINLTYYGFFNALAYCLAAAFFFLLMGSVNVPFIAASLVLIIVLGICVPASKIIAILVEGKRHTFTVGGAFFAGLFAAPAAILFVHAVIGQKLGFDLPPLNTLAAISAAYAMGEGVGRLACISFGCCYGKPLSACHPLFQRLFSRIHFVFSGETKKIAYAHRLDGQKVIPIQALTAVINCASSLMGCYLFLEGFAAQALASTVAITQGWRFVSEFFRADDRGAGILSTYQIMALLSVLFAIFLFFLLPDSGPKRPDLWLGMGSLWDPLVLLSLGGLWLGSFIYTGRSRVTDAVVRFYVVKEKI